MFKSRFCPGGCGYPILLQMMYRVLKELKLTEKAVLGLDIGCSLLAWDFLPINTFQTHHGRVVPTMLGYKRGQKQSLSIALTGDGGAYAIGLQSLIWSTMRDEPITVIVVNNSVYAMTGGQEAPTTLKGQTSDTNPVGKFIEPFLGPEYLRQLNEQAFIARSAVNEPQQLHDFFQQAFQNQLNGHFSLLEILSYCPTNWKTSGLATNNYLNNLKTKFPLGKL